jgi:outer membrane protein OmpA-like peptidoglycan-associated protein
LLTRVGQRLRKGCDEAGDAAVHGDRAKTGGAAAAAARRVRREHIDDGKVTGVTLGLPPCGDDSGRIHAVTLGKLAPHGPCALEGQRLVLTVDNQNEAPAGLPEQGFLKSRHGLAAILRDGVAPGFERHCLPCERRNLRGKSKGPAAEAERQALLACRWDKIRRGLLCKGCPGRSRDKGGGSEIADQGALQMIEHGHCGASWLFVSARWRGLGMIWDVSAGSLRIFHAEFFPEHGETVAKARKYPVSTPGPAIIRGLPKACDHTNTCLAAVERPAAKASGRFLVRTTEQGGGSNSAPHRRTLITGIGALASVGLIGGRAQAQTDGNLTRMLRELAPQDRPGAARRPPQRRQLRMRSGSSVVVDYSRRVDVTVFFDLNSATIRPDGRAALLGLGRALNNAVLADQSFLIAGHTSADGDYAYNVALSHDRANAVRDWLIAFAEVLPGRLQANGFGPDLLRNPRVPESPVNRRVEIIAVTG